jgi:Tfp pilus assembly protein PilN
MISINLIREPRRKSGLSVLQYLRVEFLIGLAAAAAAVSLLLWYWALTSEHESLQARRLDLQQQTAVLATIRAQVQQYEEQAQNLKQRTEVIEELKDSQKGPVRLMNSIISSVPHEPRLWLTGMTQEETVVEIQGKAFDVPAIADFIAKLDNTEPFQTVDLDFWEEAEESVTFELTCKVKK